MTDNKKILIVDDDKFLLDIYSIKFRASGYDVDIANNGSEAVEKIKGETSYAFVLLDVAMPVFDGFEALEQLEKDKLMDKCPIIMLTNSGRAEEIERGNKLGAKGYIIKSQHTPSEVVKIVERIVSA